MHVLSELVSEVGYLIGHCKRATVLVHTGELTEQPALHRSQSSSERSQQLVRLVRSERYINIASFEYRKSRDFRTPGSGLDGMRQIWREAMKSVSF